MEESSSIRVGDCILCGSIVRDKADFYHTGEGYCHQFCMVHMNKAR